MSAALSQDSPAGFRHEALLYAGENEFVDATLSFIEQGVGANEAVLVVVSNRKIDALKERLADKRHSVTFANMEHVGTNPARIIPAWRSFVEAGRERKQAMRGIGEPIWPERTPSELAECHHHEALLNTAFASVRRFWLMCPYDTSALRPEVIEHLARTHPFVNDGGGAVESPLYDDDWARSEHFTDPLPSPAGAIHELSYARDSLSRLRGWITDHGLKAGLGPDKTRDLVLAADEVATNSVRHGGGSGRARLWVEERELICEFVDAGHVRRPLVGRELPSKDQASGRGLWMANQLCDLVQIRSRPGQTVVRLHQMIVTRVGLIAIDAFAS